MDPVRIAPDARLHSRDAHHLAGRSGRSPEARVPNQNNHQLPCNWPIDFTVGASLTTDPFGTPKTRVVTSAIIKRSIARRGTTIKATMDQQSSPRFALKSFIETVIHLNFFLLFSGTWYATDGGWPPWRNRFTCSAVWLRQRCSVN